jgi:site-specific recombinase XerD
MSGTQRRRREPRKDFGLGQLIAAFEVRNRALNRSPRTIVWYSENLRLFQNFLQNNGYTVSLNDIGLNEVRQFIIHLQSRGKCRPYRPAGQKAEKLSPNTIRGYVQSIKSLFSWLEEEGYISDNPLRKLGSPALPKKYVKILTDEEIRRLFSYLDLNQPVSARNGAILIVLLDTGLRLAEIAGLRMEDTQIEQGYLKVLGKGVRERMVPLGALAQRLLLRYLHRFRPETALPEETNFFLAADGKPVTPNSIRLMLKRLGKMAGVPRLHAHLCRHTFATNYLVNGGNLFTLQQILGHSSLEMVRRYVNLASAHVVVQHRQFSPIDHMNLLKSRASISTTRQRSLISFNQNEYRIEEVRPHGRTI